MPDNFSQKIIDNVQPSSQKSNFASSSDLDKIKATHSRRMTRLTNIYEFLTHKTILLLIAIILFATFVVSRYYSIFHPDNKLSFVIYTDTKTAISYFGTAVASWFITKNLDK